MYYRPRMQSSSGNARGEPFFCTSTNDVAGYRICGAKAGPTALVTGFRDMIAPTFLRLAELPSLPRMQGQLILAFVDQIEAPESGISGRGIFSERIDGSIFIDFHATSNTGPDVLLRAHREVYWSVLRLCTRLGMISGRGVPPPHKFESVGREFLITVQ